MLVSIKALALGLSQQTFNPLPPRAGADEDNEVQRTWGEVGLSNLTFREMP